MAQHFTVLFAQTVRVSITDRAALNYILVSHYSEFPKPNASRRMLSELLGEGAQRCSSMDLHLISIKYYLYIRTSCCRGCRSHTPEEDNGRPETILFMSPTIC
ncbi:uncharacterized protein EI90DRAFT_3031019 [Cantharellus anzutake]|uniref:uncharacterized protein n=1 Tax=Cantharellus anzutake TaxID=1750568 RepID=UPI001904E108|nr:uncharacterized protein EI90DRAFT_3031019 [Cantharellus anzutake]KAF8342997.1 hypothetical protein EI90DRAFT_3031019 [Cantharellus anzutake]